MYIACIVAPLHYVWLAIVYTHTVATIAIAYTHYTHIVLVRYTHYKRVVYSVYTVCSVGYGGLLWVYCGYTVAPLRYMAVYAHYSEL